jgi:hypothetical protein
MAEQRKHPSGIRSAKRARRAETEKEHLDRALDDALKETFPASDPPAVLRSGGKSRRPHGRVRAGAIMIPVRNAG